MITISVNGDLLTIQSNGADNTGINATRPFHNFVEMSQCDFTPEAIHYLNEAAGNKKTHGNVGTYTEDGKTFFFWRGEKDQTLNVNYLCQLAGTDWSLLPNA